MEDSGDFSDSSAHEVASPPWPDWIRGRVVLDEIPSTQDHARTLVLSGYEPPFFVQARRQTAGRGRGENRWSAGEGALAFTLVFDPAAFGVTSNRIPTISIATALAVCEALQRFSEGVPLGIKWPNDVHAAGRKLCGILVESSPRPGVGAPVVLVGVGVNVNNDIPPDAVAGRAPAIRLAELAGGDLPIDEAFVQLLVALEREYRALGRRDASQVERWNARNVLRDREIAVERTRDASPTVGICEALDEEGALVLRVDGRRETIRSGTVAAWN